MSSRMLSRRIRSIVTGLVVAVLAIGSTAVLVRAAAMTTRYSADVQRLRQEWPQSAAGRRLERERPQRDALMARLEAVTERMGKEAEAMVADPAAAQRKQDAFGCQYLSLKFAGAAVTGAVSCGKDVGRLDLTGTRK